MTTGTIKSTPTQWLPILSGIAPPGIRRSTYCPREREQEYLYQPVSLNPSDSTTNKKRQAQI
ncbi:hypothetical protein J437_LFUL013148 [Ladona fulva]|uniref:Uncharacterized protein n=1 Tax=Ladona fulva TaxID=123851 RepID=A0A8K0KDF7_LADFU|nr:hypothetical protein J437_LFUL013148 [Ladona fulva]